MPDGMFRLRDFAARPAAWCSRNPASVAEFYSIDGSLRVNDDPPAVGRNAISSVAQSFITAFPDLRVVMNDLRLQGGEPEYRTGLFPARTPGREALVTRSASAALRSGGSDSTA